MDKIPLCREQTFRFRQFNSRYSCPLSKTFDGLLNTPILVLSFLFYWFAYMRQDRLQPCFTWRIRNAFVASLSVNTGRNITQKAEKSKSKQESQSLTWQQIKCWTLISTSQLVVSFYLVLPAPYLASWSTLGIRRTRIWSIWSDLDSNMITSVITYFWHFTSNCLQPMDRFLKLDSFQTKFDHFCPKFSASTYQSSISSILCNLLL